MVTGRVWVYRQHLNRAHTLEYINVEEQARKAKKASVSRTTHNRNGSSGNH